jgi:hypothetical protein
VLRNKSLIDGVVQREGLRVRNALMIAERIGGLVSHGVLIEDRLEQAMGPLEISLGPGGSAVDNLTAAGDGCP